MRLARALAALLLAACASHGITAPSWPDAPINLRDSGDRVQATDAMWLQPIGPARDAARAPIARAIAVRIDDAIAEQQPKVAATLLDELASLWSEEPAALGTGLAPYTKQLVALRALFAKAGTLEPAALVLVALAEVEPAQRAQHLAELDELLGYADDLGIADNGPAATRAQPIAVLRSAASTLPLPWLVDRFIELVLARQIAVSAALAHTDAAYPIVRAHRDLLLTSRYVAGTLARAGRAPEIAARLAGVQGYGYDKVLSARAQVVAEQPTASAYAELAETLRVDEKAPDPAGALAVARAGLAKYPGDGALLAAAGHAAHDDGRVAQAIAFDEAALRAGESVDGGLGLELGKLYADELDRMASAGRPTAAEARWRKVLALTTRAKDASEWDQAAAIAEGSLGRGLAAAGLAGGARYALLESLARAPSIDSYETLATLELQVGRYDAALDAANTALAQLGDKTSGDRYRRAKLESLCAESLRRSADARDAAPHYLAALKDWAALGDARDLPQGIVAERMLDSARALWWLGDPTRATALAQRAAEMGEAAPGVPAAAVAFLLAVGSYGDALDAYHRMLGDPSVPELYKVYTSLWVSGAARRKSAAPDGLATDYLRGRHGDLWYELLARAAVGALPPAQLRAAATTGPRRAELAFYTATLGWPTSESERALLQQVVDAHAIFDAEYDLARAYLGRP
ncbi:MAG TPA: hypothetical protein VGM88_25095 [Kofleriaceae bacterium]|jgi:hypothetical protein